MRTSTIVFGMVIAMVVGGVIIRMNDEPLPAKEASVAPASKITNQNHVPSSHSLNQQHPAKAIPDVGDSEKQQAETQAKLVANSETVTLWETSEHTLGIEDSPVPVKPIKADVRQLAALDKGHEVDFYIPQTNRYLRGSVEKVASIVPGVTAVDVTLEGLDSIYGMELHRGAKMTYGWVTTPEGIFNIEIDGKTGEGKIVDDKEIIAKWPLDNDTIVIEHKNEDDMIFSSVSEDVEQQTTKGEEL